MPNWWEVETLDNWMTYENIGRETLDAHIVASVKQNELMEDHKMYQELLDFANVTLLNPDQKYSSRLPNGWLKKVAETGTKTQRSFTFGPKKWMSQVEYGEKFTISFLLNEWTKSWKNIDGAPDNIQAEALGIAGQVQDLIEWYDITYAEELVKTLAKGFEVTSSEGPWSACARDWFSLFYNAHELRDSTTFSNIIEGDVDYTDVNSGKAKLQDAIDKLKTMRFDNGKKIKQPKWEPYKLFCSRVRETYWLEVINNWSDKAWLWSNSAKENTFSFQNNLVQVVAIDLLWDLDVDWNVIGNDDMWFVSNPMAVRKLEAFKCAQLYPPRIKTWENDETDEVNTSIRAIIGTGHYDAEFAIVGCKWTEPTPEETEG